MPFFLYDKKKLFELRVNGMARLFFHNSHFPKSAIVGDFILVSFAFFFCHSAFVFCFTVSYFFFILVRGFILMCFFFILSLCVVYYVSVYLLYH